MVLAQVALIVAIAGPLFSPSLENKKNLLYFFQKEDFLIFK